MYLKYYFKYMYYKILLITGRSNVRLCRKDEISTQNSFDIVAVFGNKVERCFDIVAGVNGA